MKVDHLFLCAFLTVCPLLAWAQDSVREQEIAQCREGELRTWGDGQDRAAVGPALAWAYDHADAPGWWSEGQVRRVLGTALAAWAPCGVPSIVLPPGAAARSPYTVVRVGWSDANHGGRMAYANITQASLTLVPAAFALLRERQPGLDPVPFLQMTLAHEMGHLYGLIAHSRRCVDVTSYYGNGKGESCFARDLSLLKTMPEYRSTLPTACDLQRCRRLNTLVTP